MRLHVMLILLLVVGCQAPPPEDYRPTAKDHIYRPLTPLPRHKKYEKPTAPPPKVEKIVVEAAPTQPKQYVYNTTNNTYNTTNNYNYQSTVRAPSYLTYRPRSVYPRYRPRNDGYRGYTEVYHRPCSHVRVPINEQRWQAPVYKPHFQGYDACGLPIYVQGLISPGGWYTVTVGYKCRRCGCRL